MPKWEYLRLINERNEDDNLFYWQDLPDTSTKDFPPQERLNQLGEQGWELAAAFPSSTWSGERMSGYTTRTTYWLKREVA
jgi:hypothetical protein